MSSDIIKYDNDFMTKKRYEKRNIKITYDFNSNVFIKISTEKLKTKRKVVKEDQTKNKFIFRMPEKADATEIKKNINIMINSLSENNIDIIVEKLKKLMINDNYIHYTISCLFNHAINNSLFIHIYVQLFKKIYKKNKKEMINIINHKQELMNELINNSEMKEGSTYDDFCSYIKDKTTYVNIYELITQLFKEKMITKKLFLEYINILFKGMTKYLDDDEKRTIMVESIKTIFMNLDDIKIYNKYKNRIQKLMKYLKQNKKNREKYIILDIQEKYVSE